MEGVLSLSLSLSLGGGGDDDEDDAYMDSVDFYTFCLWRGSWTVSSWVERDTVWRMSQCLAV